MLQEEVIDIVTEEIIEFLETYITMTSLTHEAFTLKIEPQKSMEFGRYSDWFNWRGEQHFNTRHSISKVGRTKLNFSFKFYEDEAYYAIQLNRLLDGYVNYRLSNSNGYYYSFTLDVGSKENCINLFERLNFLSEWTD